MPAPFIVIDGPDGAGTTTHAKLLAEQLKSNGKDVLLTCEPTDGPIGTFVRSVLKWETPVSPDALQLLFTADRAFHVHHTLEPSLKAGTAVVTDRYLHSTIAYGIALGLDATWLQTLNNNFIHPTHTIFLLPPLEICLERLAKRANHDMLETRSLQQKVHAAYRALAEENANITVIDSSASPEDTASAIWHTVQGSL